MKKQAKTKPVKKSVAVSPAQKWIDCAIEEHSKFTNAFDACKTHALLCGVFLSRAKAATGDWMLELEVREFPHRSACRYMEFSAEVIEWARAANPKLVKEDDILKAAKVMVLESPKGLVALCRDLKLMRQFGEYDAVKHAAEKRRLGLQADGQLEFTFKQFVRANTALAVFDESWGRIDASISDADIADMTARMERALARLKQLRQPIDIDTVSTALEKEPS